MLLSKSSLDSRYCPQNSNSECSFCALLDCSQTSADTHLLRQVSLPSLPVATIGCFFYEQAKKNGPNSFIAGKAPKFPGRYSHVDDPLAGQALQLRTLHGFCPTVAMNTLASVEWQPTRQQKDAEDRRKRTAGTVNLLRGKCPRRRVKRHVRPESSDSPGIRSTKNYWFTF